MAGNSARPSAAASDRHPVDPLTHLARMIADERGGSRPRRPAAAEAEDEGFRFEEDPALRGAADDGRPDPAYPPEAYAGVPYDGDDDGARPDLRRRGGGVTLAALVLVLAVVAGGGVYGYRLIAHPHAFAGGTPPVIKASTEPVKVAPKQTADAKNQNKLIYDRVTSDTPAPAHVVGSAEEPGERPVAVTDDSTHVVLPGPRQDADVGATASAAPGQPDDGVDARQVKTIAIQPDGNVVLPQVPPQIVRDNAAPPPAPAQQAGTEVDAATRAEAAKIMAAVADPKAPVQGSGVAAGLTLMPNDRTGIMVGGDGGHDGPKPTAAAAASQASAPLPAAAPAAAPSTPQIASAPVPLPEARPSRLGGAEAARAVGAPIRLTPGPRPAAPAPSPQRTAALTAGQPEAGAGDYMVQLSSQRSEADARSTFAKLQARFASVLGRYQPVIAPVKLGDRGTFYRVRVGGFRTKELAAAVCDNLKAAGGACIVQTK
ncbi:MAG TPA: SPOR domain-containing protein [Hyphomicrobiales bacterium]|nr:SPOR domain-containing protein [Hyphomicrobiales bacterium]